MNTATLTAREQVDVLLVRGDTTLGLRRGDDSLAEALRRSGCSIAEVSPDYKVTRLLRATRVSARLGVLPDLTESFDARRATAAALTAFQPRCIIYSPGFTANLQPKSTLQLPNAVRFDTPPSMARRGRWGVSVLKILERRAFRNARLLLPWGVRLPETLLEALPQDGRVVPLPIPVARGAPDRVRSDTAVTYASSNPHKKGLDIVLSAWRHVAPPDMRLAIAGIAPDEGRRWCRRHRLEVPATIDWVGRLEPGPWRRLLSTCAIYLAASRWEDHGIAQLEALAQGALLVTAPSAGPFEPLSLAKELPGRLVAEEISAPALAEALSRACDLSEDLRAAYRTSARALTTVYSEAALDELLRNRVLPQLLS